MTLQELYTQIETNVRELTKDYYVVSVEKHVVKLQGHYDSDVIRKLPQVLQDDLKFENDGEGFCRAKAGLDEYDYIIRIVLT